MSYLWFVVLWRAGGGEEWHLVWPQFWSSIWTPSGNGKTQMTSPIPTPKSKPRDFSEPPQTIDNEDSLITFANNNRNRQWTNKTPWSKYTWPVSNSPYAWLRQTSKFHQQASFVNKIFCICTFCAWVFFSTLLPWEFISVKLRLFLISKRGLVVKFACVT